MSKSPMLPLLCLFISGSLAATAQPRDQHKAISALCHQATILTDHQEYEQALTILKRAQSLDPKNAETYYVLGKTYFYNDEKEKAIKSFEEAYRLDPACKDRIYFKLWGHAQILQNRPEEAIKIFIWGLKSMPDSTDLMCERGCTYSLMGQHAKGLPDLNEAIKLSPNNAHYFMERGHIYRSLHQYDKALNDYSKRIQLEPHNSRCYVDRAEIYKLMNKPELAKQDMDQSIKMNMIFLDGSKL